MSSIQGPERGRTRDRDPFDPIDEGKRYQLSSELALAIWARARAEATDAGGRCDVVDAQRRFHEIAARVTRRAHRSRGGRLYPDVGRLTRVEVESSGGVRPARGDPLGCLAPGRRTLVEAEWPEPEVDPDIGPALEPAIVPAAEDRERTRITAAVRSLGAGAPLAPQLQRDYGARLGIDLASVRLHLDSSAPRELGALAFTHGTHIAVAPGVDVESPGGGHVLAHELVHVAQNLQAGAPMQLAAMLEVGPSDSPLEQEAEAGAEALRGGQAFRVAARGSLPNLSLYHGPLVPQPRLPTRGPATGHQPSIDQLVHDELEKRADPARKAGYGKACAQIDILRIQAIQYTFSPSGIGEMILQSLWPWQTVKDHWDQISNTNPYPDGSLLRFIESTRAVIRILGDIAAWVGTIADVASIVSGLLALLTSETIVGGVGFAGIAGILAEAGMIAGCVKVLLDLLDVLLGIVQIIILVNKIRNSKDPNERAKLAALLGRECETLAATATSVVVQVATMAVTAGLAAGVSAALAKSVTNFRSTLRTSFGAEFNAMRAVREIKQISATHRALDRRYQTADPSKITDAELKGAEVIAWRVTYRKELVKSRLSKGKRDALKKKRELRDLKPEVHWTRPVVRREDLPKPPKNTPGDNKTRHVLYYVVDTKKLRRGIALEDLPENALSLGTGQTGGLVQGQSGVTTGSTSPPGVDEHALPPSSLTHVEMWPTMLTKLTEARKHLPDANAHVMDQYNRARDQAGPDQALKVEATLGAITTTSGQLRFRAVQQQADAVEGAANAQRGSTAAQNGVQSNTQVQSSSSTLDGCVHRLGGQKVDKPKPKPGNWLDSAGQWLTDHTVGQLGKWTSSLQKLITRTVGSMAMAKAGLTKDELDMAGIDDSMRKDELKDHKSEADAKAAEQEAAKVDPEVAKLMEGASQDQQVAIQAMVDAQQFMTAIDEAHAELDDLITEGAAYIAQAEPIIRHEMEIQRARKTIDAAYVGFGKGAASKFKDTASAHEDLAEEPAREVIQELHDAKAMWPDLNIEPGRTAVDNAKRRFHDRHHGAVSRAIAASDRAIGELDGLIGTTNYAGVTAALERLDGAIAAFDNEEIGSADADAADLAAILDAYSTLIESSVSPEEVPVAADPSDGD